MGLLMGYAAMSSARDGQLLSNPAFADAAAWNLGTGWGISGGVASRGPQASGSSISQPISLIPGCMYQVTFTITALVPGSVRVRFTGGTAVDGIARTTTGTFTENLIALPGNNTFAISANTAATDVSVDDVSVIRVHG